MSEAINTIKKIDLHIHTNRSDGTFSPEEAVDYAHKIGLAAIAITDHDTVSGVAPAIEHAGKYGLEVVPGIEISAEWTEGGREMEVHMLGYFVDYRNEDFKKGLEELSCARIKRTERILEKLRGSGIALDIEDVQAFAPSTDSLGRLHIAQAMVKEGSVPSIRHAFDRYIGNNKSCYVPKHQLNPEGAVKKIKEVNGLAVIAHPGLLERTFAENMVGELAKAGLDGIEAYYPEHRPEVTRYFESLAKEHSLLVTGGTDCHGLARRRIVMGTLPVPYAVLEKMKNRK